MEHPARPFGSDRADRRGDWVAFPRRLRDAVVARGWDEGEAARRIREHLPRTTTFAADHLAGYLAGRLRPDPRHLSALGRALGVAESDLVHLDLGRLTGSVFRGRPSNDDRPAPSLPGCRVKDLGNGQAWLQLNQRLPRAVAALVLAALGRASASGTEQLSGTGPDLETGGRGGRALPDRRCTKSGPCAGPTGAAGLSRREGNVYSISSINGAR